MWPSHWSGMVTTSVLSHLHSLMMWEDGAGDTGDAGDMCRRKRAGMVTSTSL